LILAEAHYFFKPDCRTAGVRKKMRNRINPALSCLDKGIYTQERAGLNSATQIFGVLRLENLLLHLIC